jgi:hypothetical protein
MFADHLEAGDVERKLFLRHSQTALQERVQPISWHRAAPDAPLLRHCSY